MPDSGNKAVPGTGAPAAEAHSNAFAGYRINSSAMTRSMTNPESPEYHAHFTTPSFGPRSHTHHDIGPPPPHYGPGEGPVAEHSGASDAAHGASHHGSRTAGLWARSKSFAEGYIKPTTNFEQAASRTRSRTRSGPRRASADASPSRPPLPERGDSSNMTDSESQPATRKGSVAAGSRTPVFANPESGARRRGTSASASASKTRRDRKMSFTEYFRPSEISERGRRRSMTVKTASTPSDTGLPSANSVRPSFDRGGSGPFGSSKTAEFPSHVPASRRPSSVIESIGESNPGVPRSLLNNERSILQPGVYFESRRLKDPSTDLSWLKHKGDSRTRWLFWIPLVGIFLGFAIAGVNIYLGARSVPTHKYCMVYEDDFSSGTLNETVWTKEVQVGGFGNGEFEETTGGDENVFIEDGMLHIRPTMQDTLLLTSNYTLNLTALGTCTSDMWYNCVATTNQTNGTIIPPTRSGRINSRKGANIQFGRVEVVARMPQGNWLWPAIWLMPTDSVYGPWPQSGEIDIAESRGNNWTYQAGGNNIVSSALHWGPDQPNDNWWRTYSKISALHSTFSNGFHTFGLEWSEKYLYTYVDSRLMQVFYTKFSTPFWQRGKFPLTYPNGTAVDNPWAATGSAATPFDQNFFLILNVAVGGTNGWFPDGMGDKPWVDSTHTAPVTFWAARDQWLPTWDNNNGPALQVKSVKMWQQQGYNGCGDNAVSIPP